MSKSLLVRRIHELCSRDLRPILTETAPALEARRDIRAVLFDVYGTLFVSGSGDIGVARAGRRTGALSEALADSGFTGDLKAAGDRGTRLFLASIEKQHAEARKSGVEFPEVDICQVWEEVVAQLRGQGVLSGNPSRKTARRLAVEYECRVNPLWPMPGVKRTLRSLRERGMALGIISNAQFFTPMLFESLLDMSLAEAGFDEALCIWSYEAGEAKPSVRLYEDALHRLQTRLQIEPRAALFVGNDMLNDIWPAAQSGFTTALFAGDLRSLRIRENDKRCQNVVPDLVITKLEQLPGCLV
jgi:putative hydrolase of the HAD superfamily